MRFPPRLAARHSSQLNLCGQSASNSVRCGGLTVFCTNGQAVNGTAIAENETLMPGQVWLSPKK